MTTKKEKKNSKNNTRKKTGGSDDDIPCGINSKGENIKCPPNHRCEIMQNGKKLCKKSVDIKLEYNNESFTIQVPWKRHEKWLSYIDVLNQNIAVENSGYYFQVFCVRLYRRPSEGHPRRKDKSLDFLSLHSSA